MPDDDRDPPSREPEVLLRLNRALDEQVKVLVKTEQRLFVSQRELVRQNAQLEALNRFAIDAAAFSEPREILARAADVLFSLFPLDQGVGFLAREDGALVPTAVAAVEGCGEGVATALDEWGDVALRVDLPRQPETATAAAMRASGLAPLLDAIDRVFAGRSDEPVHPDDAPISLVPIARRGGEPMGVLVLRRLTPALSFHEELPTAKDAGFLGVFARVVAASVSHAGLVRDLRVSYEKLAQAQRELVDRERLAALGEFSAIVANEVRNPLGVIFNVLSMVRRLAPEGDLGVLVRILHEEAARLDTIVADLLDFARPQPPKLRPEEMTGIVENAIASVRASIPEVAIDFVAEPDVPDVVGDARMLQQAVVNLLVNAAQATPAGAPVVVRLGSSCERFAEIAVEDRGPGLSPEVSARMFEPFFTTKPAGTGLGLSVVKRVVELHRGEIGVTPGRGGGSVFTLRVPIVGPSIAEAPAAEAPIVDE